MAAIKFGTDGVRGRAHHDVTVADAFLIARAAAEVFGGSSAVIGRDTRESGPAFTAAVAAGLRAGGVEPFDLGIAPTPAVAFVARQRDAIGVVISASHNPWQDNGIKLFSRTGSKLSDRDQQAVEARLAELSQDDVPSQPTGHADSVQQQMGEWVAAVQRSIEVELTGLHVVVDCANGAASHVAGPALTDLGAQVTVLYNEPTGQNINAQCGSTHPEALAAVVVELGADLGLAFDGDADRLVAVDGTGNRVDGDVIMALLAIDLNDRGLLAGSQLVVTVMSNLGLLRAMEAANISVQVTPVGDRHVLMALDRLNANFGGEQSGHLIFASHGGTGDGLLSGIQLMALLQRKHRPLADLATEVMTLFPQVLRNVVVSEKMPDIADRIRAQIDAAESALGRNGRVLVRASGTEPVIRVMVEAADADMAARVCDELCRTVEALR